MHSSVNGYLGCFYVPAIINSAAMNIWRRQWQPTPVLLPGRSHGRRSLVGCSPWSRKELDMTERLHFHFSLSCTGEGNGNPLHCSCLENPRDRGAWRAALYGVTQSQTRLKRLSGSSSYEYTGAWIFFFKLDLCPDICPGVGLLDYMATPSFLRNLHTIFQHFTLPPIV